MLAGKTSFVKCLANKTKRSIVNISLKFIETNEQFQDFLYSTTYHVKGEDVPITMELKDVIFSMEEADIVMDILKQRKKDSAGPEDKDGNSTAGAAMGVPSAASVGPLVHASVSTQVGSNDAGDASRTLLVPVKLASGLLSWNVLMGVDSHVEELKGAILKHLGASGSGQEINMMLGRVQGRLQSLKDNMRCSEVDLDVDAPVQVHLKAVSLSSASGASSSGGRTDKLDLAGILTALDGMYFPFVYGACKKIR